MEYKRVICAIKGHKWGIWREKISSPFAYDQEILGERECERCGKIQQIVEEG